MTTTELCMNHRSNTTPVKLALAAALALALAACSTVPPENADLVAARSALSQARANPAAARAAAVELERAQQALQRAESAWADKRDNEETQHLAYVARRRAEVVSALAARAQAEERIQQAGAERERARLEARTREAEAAARVASAAQADARTAQASAQAAQGQAVQSQQDAEAARQQALRAQQQAQQSQQQTQQAQQQAEAERARAAQQAERAAALERDLQTLQAKNTQRGLVVTMGDVLFATGQATLQPGAQRSVQQLAEVLRQYPERRVLVEGFTDNVGSEPMNLALSERRAEAMRRALLNAGVAAERIEVRAHGLAYPVADNSTAAGRQQNRRVEVLFSDAQGRFAQR